MPITFLHPAFWLMVLLAVPVLRFWSKRQPSLGHSQVNIHGNLRSIPLIGVLPKVFMVLALTAMAGALARPVLPHTVEHQAIETRDIVIIMDISGSMDDPIHGSSIVCKTMPDGSVNCHDNTSTHGLRKIDVAPVAIRYFVEQRQGDRVALGVFDDDTYWHWPLTTDLSVIIKKTYILNQYTGGGTNFDGPDPASYETGTGPIQAAIDHFRQYSKAKSKVFIMVTDGGSTISPKRFQQLSEAIDKLGIHMYVLGVGDDWTGGDPSTNDLRRFVAAVHGHLFNAGSEAQLKLAVESINQLEKSKVELETHTDYRDIYSYFLLAALAFWGAFLLAGAASRQTA